MTIYHSDKAADIRAVAEFIAKERAFSSEVDALFLADEGFEPDPDKPIYAQVFDQALDYLAEYADYVAYSEGEGGS